MITSDNNKKTLEEYLPESFASIRYLPSIRAAEPRYHLISNKCRFPLSCVLFLILPITGRTVIFYTQYLLQRSCSEATFHNHLPDFFQPVKILSGCVSLCTPLLPRISLIFYNRGFVGKSEKFVQILFQNQSP